MHSLVFEIESVLLCTFNECSVTIVDQEATRVLPPCEEHVKVAIGIDIHQVHAHGELERVFRIANLRRDVGENEVALVAVKACTAEARHNDVWFAITRDIADTHATARHH